MKYYMLKTGRIRENTYFLVNEQNKTLIVDPGDNTEQLVAFIQHHQLKPVAIILTHAHWDHIQSVDDLRQQYNIKVYVHELEKDFLSDPVLNLSSRHKQHVRLSKPDVLFTQMGHIEIDDFKCRIAHIPGHSPGSIAYLFDDDKLAVVGDTLFKGGCGRTDLPGSSTHLELMHGIYTHLMTLPDDTIVLSGHGDETTIGYERATNPYLNGVSR